MAAELTVGLIAQDNPAGLMQSAACVFNQSWQGDIALCIVDGGITDHTLRVVERLEEDYDTVHVMRESRHAGSAHSRNQLIRSADSKYLAWIDVGDLWHPHKLELQFQALEAAPLSRFVLPAFPDCLDAGFTGMLGETESYRALGALDERLSCLADEEFLLRLILSDVPTTTVRAKYKLFTARRKAPECEWKSRVAEVCHVWRKHGRTISRKFSRQAGAGYRRRQLVILADSASRQGKHLQAARYRTWMRAIELTAAAPGNPVTATKRWIRQAGRVVGKRILYLGARLITLCRLEPDSALIVGIIKVMDAPGAKRRHALVPAFNAFILSPSTTAGSPASEARSLTLSDRGALTVAAAATAAGNAERAVGVLEAHVDRHAPRVAPQMFERLADVLLIMNSVEYAAETLRRGLRTYPDSGRLHRALARTLAWMSEWAEAVTHWEQVPEDLREAASVWTSIVVARAYRLAGNPLMADELARRAAESQPDNDQLEEEIRLCRPFLVDWSRCLVSADPAQWHGQIGEITSMGFLNGGSEPLAGRVTSPEKGSPEVLLCVNNRAMAATVAAETSNTSPGKAFSINCTELLQYLGDGDIVQVTCNGNAISLPGLGSAAMVYCGQPSRLDMLQKRLDRGYVFTKDGRLRPGHDDDSKRAVLDFYEDVSSVLEAATGQPVFPFYGNLLGAVREGDFIVHDVDGFDVVYLCGGNRPGDVKTEVAKVCRLLIEEGYDLQLEPWSVMIRKNHPDTMFIDMNYGWFTPSDELNVSFGWRFEPAPGRARFVASRRCRLADREVSIPGNAEEVLQQLYGPQWRVRDQGFSARKRLRRDDTYLLTTSEIQSIANSS